MAEDHEECPAVAKLTEWLLENSKSQAWLAGECDVKPPSVHAWMTRVSRPVTHLRSVIEAVTSGHVAVPDWEFPSEREKRESAQKKVRDVGQAGDAA